MLDGECSWMTISGRLRLLKLLVARKYPLKKPRRIERCPRMIRGNWRWYGTARVVKRHLKLYFPAQLVATRRSEGDFCAKANFDRVSQNKARRLALANSRSPELVLAFGLKVPLVWPRVNSNFWMRFRLLHCHPRLSIPCCDLESNLLS